MPTIQRPLGFNKRKPETGVLRLFQQCVLGVVPLVTAGVTRWVTERDRLRRWGAKLFSSFNAQRNRCDFLQDLHPDVISCFQQLVPER